MYDVERRMAMELMLLNRASSTVDSGYTELFCIPAVTSVSLKTCDSVPRDSLEFHQANQGSLRV